MINFVRKFFGKDNDEVLKSYKNILLSHTITGYLGSGSMGKVYKVRDNSSNEEFALKITQFKNSKGILSLSMAEREVNCLQKLAELNHPHILHFYNAGVSKQWPRNMPISDASIPQLPSSDASIAIIFMITELCSTSLKDKLDLDRNDVERDKVLFLQAMKKFAIQLADALCYIHQFKIIHRDINPSNILLQNGDAKIGDFGISRFTPQNEGSKSLTTGYRRGWLNYQSPEQRRGLSYTVQCDVFSLGITFFEMFHPDLVEANTNNMASLYDSENMTADADALAEITEPGLRILLAGMLSNVERRPTAASVYEQLTIINT